MMRVKALMSSVLVLLCLASACNKSKSEEAKEETSSGAEKAGAAVDEAAEDTGEAVEEAGDKVDKKL